MKKDIHFPENAKVQVAIVPPKEGGGFWEVLLLNKNEFPIKNILITSSGYGEDPNGNSVYTSTLRFFFETISSESIQKIENIRTDVFGLTNEYWVSFWIQDQLYDRRFLFVPESISQNHLIYVGFLEKEAILHA